MAFLAGRKVLQARPRDDVNTFGCEQCPGRVPELRASERDDDAIDRARARRRAEEGDLLREMRRERFEEARGLGGLEKLLAVPSGDAGSRCEVEPVSRAGHADVGQPALLLQLTRVEHGAVVGKGALLHPDHEDRVELQALGRVHGHERHLGRGHCFTVLALPVYLRAVQHNLLQVSLQRFLASAAHALGPAPHLLDVLPTRRPVRHREQVRVDANKLAAPLDQLGHRQRARLLFQRLEREPELHQPIPLFRRPQHLASVPCHTLLPFPRLALPLCAFPFRALLHRCA
eukprot:3382935-Rhodomonas_salina.1